MIKENISSANNQLKKVAFIGIKGIGKDYIQNKFASYLENKNIYSIRMGYGDILKIKSVDNHPKWQYNGYLEKDFSYLKEYQKELEKEEKYRLKEITNKNFFKKNFNELSIDEKREIIEITKNIPNLLTRKALQYFGDFYKEEKNSHFIFFEYFKKELKNYEQTNYKYIFNTDTRFLSEFTGAILQDFFFIKLLHEDIFKIENTDFPHLSELELSLENEIKIGLEQNTKGEIKDLKGLYRLSTEEFENEVFPKFEEKINNFKGYSEEDKKEIQNIIDQYLSFDSSFYKISSEYLSLNEKEDKEKKEMLKEKYLKEKRYILKMIAEILEKYYK